MSTTSIHQHLIDKITAKNDVIQNWLFSKEKSEELPLYSSVDIRDAGFKLAVVDTNLFPAGFNNLSQEAIARSIEFIKQAINERVVNGKNILIIAEEHTRNTWYLENVWSIEHIIKQAGFNAKVATFLDDEPVICQKTHSIELETAKNKKIRIYCFRTLLEQIKSGEEEFDLIIMNNDMTSGLPEILKEAKAPIYPSLRAGWHSRLKSHHFRLANELFDELAQMIDIDPWLLSAFFTDIGNIDINEQTHREQLADVANELIQKIQKKYLEHHIDEKPFVFLKSDSGTYGMGVLPIEDAQDIIELNRKNRNKLYKGKSAQVISRFLIQEGVPTIHSVGEKVSEVCIYQIANRLVGGFYRSHSGKGSRENLNSQGMDFSHLSDRLGCHQQTSISLCDLYKTIARIAGIAAHREIIQLEQKQN